MSLATLQNQISAQIENRTDLVLAYSDTNLHDCISIYQQNGLFWLSYNKDKLLFKHEAEEILNNYPVVDSPEFRPLTKTILVGNYDDFWNKYYKNRQNERLEKIGTTLFGQTWQTQLAKLLNVDSRRIRQWLALERPIKPEIWLEIKKIAQKHQTAINDLISNF
jgi:hypothetical protein